MTSLLSPRNLLPAAATLAATFLLVNATPQVGAPGPATIVVHAASLDFTQAELGACEARIDRSHDDCVEEAQGKALIRSAERIAQLDSRSGISQDDELALAAYPRPSRSGAR